MAFNVYSDGPLGKSVKNVDKPSRVRQVVSQLEAEGHQNIFIGETWDSATPFDQWEIRAAGVSVSSV